MSIFAKAKKARENKKGFTLVELIVVLVILAILAAMLVPALLGWIDEARQKQFVLEARNVYMATQAYVDELYAAGEPLPTTGQSIDDWGTGAPASPAALSDEEGDGDADSGDGGDTTVHGTAFERISEISDAIFANIIITKYSEREGDSTAKAAEISEMVIQGLNVNGSVADATLENGEWKIEATKVGL